MAVFNIVPWSSLKKQKKSCFTHKQIKYELGNVAKE